MVECYLNKTRLSFIRLIETIMYTLLNYTSMGELVQLLLKLLFLDSLVWIRIFYTFVMDTHKSGI